MITVRLSRRFKCLLLFLFTLCGNTYAHGDELSTKELSQIYSSIITSLNTAIDAPENSQLESSVVFNMSDTYSVTLKESALFNIFRNSLKIQYDQMQRYCKENKDCSSEELSKKFSELNKKEKIRYFFNQKVLPKLKRIKGFVKGVFKDFILEALLKSPSGVKRYGVSYAVLTIIFEAFDHAVLDAIGVQVPLCKFFQAITLGILGEVKINQKIIFQKTTSEKVTVSNRFKLMLKRYQYRREMKKHLKFISKINSEPSYLKIENKEKYIKDKLNLSEMKNKVTGRLHKAKEVILGVNFWDEKNFNAFIYHDEQFHDKPRYLSTTKEIKSMLEGDLDFTKYYIIDRHRYVFESLLRVKTDEIIEEFYEKKSSLKSVVKKTWALGEVGRILDNYTSEILLLANTQKVSEMSEELMNRKSNSLIDLFQALDSNLPNSNVIQEKIQILKEMTICPTLLTTKK